MKQFKDYTFTAKHKLSGKKIDATEAVMELYGSVDAWKEVVEGQQAILVDAVNRLERIQEAVTLIDWEDTQDVFGALSNVKTLLEEE